MMISTDYCKLMADYNAWMNERLYKLCGHIGDDERKRDRGAFFGSIHSTLNHLLYGDLAAMSRFTRDPASAPELGIDLFDDFGALQQARWDLDNRISAWSSTLTDEWLRERHTYTSQVDGKSRTVPRWILAVHMYNHQTHHRGQLTTLLSQLGHDIGTTDIPFMPQFS